MPLNRSNCKEFHRKLYAGQLETIHILKREDDQREGIVRCYKLFSCRRSMIYKTSQPIRGDMSADHRTTWHIPRMELKRVGIKWLNALDIIKDNRGRYWNPESTTTITEKLFSTHIDLDCLRVDPPNVTIIPG